MEEQNKKAFPSINTRMSESLIDELDRSDGIFTDPFLLTRSKKWDLEANKGQKSYRFSIWRLDCSYGPT